MAGDGPLEVGLGISEGIWITKESGAGDLLSKCRDKLLQSQQEAWSYLPKRVCAVHLTLVLARFDHVPR